MDVVDHTEHQTVSLFYSASLYSNALKKEWNEKVHGYGISAFGSLWGNQLLGVKLSPP